MPVFNHAPVFLYPKSRQFLFDEVCEEIVNAIEKRNWKVPGLRIKFSNYGSGEAKYCYVSEICGDEFKLHFCRVQGKLGKYNDIAAVSEITIPLQQICVHDDESGPTYYLYVGEDWEADKDKFINGIKVNSKRKKEPRTYLMYEGGWDGVHLYQGRRPPLLLSYNDLGREYEPEGDEPTEFVLEDKLKEFTDWLNENVLGYILTFPEAEVIDLPFTVEEIIPYKGEWPIVFSTSNWEFRERVLTGKKNPKDLEPQDRQACFSSQSRLVPLDLAWEDEDITGLARDGFIWCDTNQRITKRSSHNCLVNDARGGWDDKLIVAIKLKYANEVYVIDNAAFEEMREQIFEEIAPRNRLTDVELGVAYAARGKTIIPINEYKGGYKEPIVLIRRELDFDEIAWIQKEEAKKKIRLQIKLEI